MSDFPNYYDRWQEAVKAETQAMDEARRLRGELAKARAEVTACDGHGYLRDQIKVLLEKLAAVQPALDAKDSYIRALERARDSNRKLYNELESVKMQYGYGENDRPLRAELRREKALRLRTEERLEILKRSVRACEETLTIETAPRPRGCTCTYCSRLRR